MLESLSRQAPAFPPAFDAQPRCRTRNRELAQTDYLASNGNYSPPRNPPPRHSLPHVFPLDDVDDLGLDRRRHLVSFLREQEAERTKKRNVLGEAIPRMRRFACQAERAESRPVDETASALELRDERVLRRKDVLDLFPELGAVIIPSRITDVPVGLSSSASGSPGGASGTHQS